MKKPQNVGVIAAAALLAIAGTAGAMTIFNPDYTIVITHESQTASDTNFGGAFSSSDGGVNLVDNKAFVNTPTSPRVTSCAVDGAGNCTMPTTTMTGQRPGDVIFASEIIWGIQSGSFSDLSRSGDRGIYAPMAPDTPPPDPLKCVADICDTARKAQEDANTIALAQVRGDVLVGKWVVTGVTGVLGAFTPLKGYGSALFGGAAYVLTKEAGSDTITALDDGQKSAVVIAYNKCKKKCGA